LIVIPAIDLKDGQCVRLVQGDPANQTVYSADPAAVARRWQVDGAPYLHVVDLDGAFAGEPRNMDAIRGILNVVDIPVQVGGGIRAADTIEKLLSAGVERVILGTVACESPPLVADWCRRFGPEHIVVGIDARDGMVAVRGWQEATAVSALDLAQTMAAAGVRRLIFTDIHRDGMLTGPNLESLRVICGAGIPVIASGGISSLADARSVASLAGEGVEGMIIGKALYTGDVELREVLELCREKAD